MLAEWGGNLSLLLLLHHNPISTYFIFCTFQASMTCAFLSVTLNVSSLSKEGTFGFCVHPLPISTGARCRCLRDVCQIKQNEFLKLQKHSSVAHVLTGAKYTGSRQIQCPNHWELVFSLSGSSSAVMSVLWGGSGLGGIFCLILSSSNVDTSSIIY